eukprot:2195121-Rhodomonas_salina.2
MAIDELPPMRAPPLTTQLPPQQCPYLSTAHCLSLSKAVQAMTQSRYSTGTVIKRESDPHGRLLSAHLERIAFHVLSSLDHVSLNQNWRHPSVAHREAFGAPPWSVPSYPTPCRGRMPVVHAMCKLCQCCATAPCLPVSFAERTTPAIRPPYPKIIASKHADEEKKPFRWFWRRRSTQLRHDQIERTDW